MIKMSGSVIQFIGEWPPPENDEKKKLDRSTTLQTKCIKSDGDQMHQSIEVKEALRRPKARKRDNLGACVDMQSVEIRLQCRQKSSGRTALSDIAKWWKSQGSSNFSSFEMPSGCKGKSAVRLISRTKDGKAFLKSSVVKLRSALDTKCDSADDWFLLGTYYDIMGDFQKAYNCFKRAQDLRRPHAELLWHLKKCEKNLHTLRHQATLLKEKGKEESKEHSCFKVERRDCSSLSTEAFYKDYELTNTPVIITGLANSLTEFKWTMEYIKKNIRSKRCPLRVFSEWSGEWAKLETEERDSLISDFADSILDGTEKQKYLFDWSLPLYAPKLLKDFKVPMYFASDYLQRTLPGTLYQDSWPSLFIAPKGTGSHLHVDAFGSNFWMALFQGRKKWTFFPKEDIAMLYPKYENSMDANFDIDISSPNLSDYPLFKFARRTECVLEEGEVLFVPHGCPHQVENLETTLAISGNFVDQSNIATVIEALSYDALLDSRASDLLTQLQSPDFPKIMDFRSSHMPWKDFKSWWHNEQNSEPHCE